MLILFIVSVDIKNYFCYMEKDFTDYIFWNINEVNVCVEVFFPKKIMESKCCDTPLSHGVLPLRDDENLIFESSNHWGKRFLSIMWGGVSIWEGVVIMVAKKFS